MAMPHYTGHLSKEQIRLLKRREAGPILLLVLLGLAMMLLAGMVRAQTLLPAAPIAPAAPERRTGDSRSREGGLLLLTPLYGRDGKQIIRQVTQAEGRKKTPLASKVS